MMTARNLQLVAVALLVSLVLIHIPACTSTEPSPGKPEPQLDELSRKIADALPPMATKKPEKQRKVLVFSLCSGFAHDVIPTANKAFGLMGRMTGAYEADFSTDMASFTTENLAQYDAVLFNNTTRLAFENPGHRKALMDFVKSGKGIIGAHAASDNFYDWPEAAEMIGGLFDGHPWGAGGTWAVMIDEPAHPLNRAFNGKGFLIRDEIYQFKAPYSRDTHRVLLSLDMSSPRNNAVQGIKRDDGDFAISWIRDFGDGRVFYCSLGHNHEVFWNKAVLRHYLDGIQYALGDLEVDATPSAKLDRRPKPARTTDPGGVEDPYQVVKTYEFGASRSALSSMEEEIRAASPEALPGIETKLIEVLETPDATYAGKQFVCRLLRRMGSERSIPVLAPLLRDEKLSDPARFALEGMESEKVDKAFWKALDKVEGDLQIGLIGSIGQRKNARALPQLKPLLKSKDQNVVEATICALGLIGGKKAAQLLDKANVPDDLESSRCDACLICADSMLDEGKVSDALAIFRKMAEKETPGTIRLAAWRGIARARGEEAIPDLIVLLGGDDIALQEGAARFLIEMPAEANLIPVAEALPTLSAQGQVLALAALSARGEKAAAPAAAKAAASEDDAVCVAALQALGWIGGPDDVEVLANAAATDGAAGDAAFKSLTRLSGNETNTAILTCARKHEGAVRAVLVDALAERKPEGAIPVFLKYAEDENSQVRHAAFKALETYAGPDELPAFLNMLKRPLEDGDQEGLERAILAVCKRIESEEEQTRLLLAALPQADDSTRASLILIIGNLPSERTLEPVLEAVEDENETVRGKAIHALAEWPDAGPMDTLARVASTADNDDHRMWALRGYLRMAKMQKDRPSEETREVYTIAMAAAKRPEEKKIVIKNVSGIAEMWVLDFLEPSLNDAALKAEAEKVYDKVSTAFCKTVPHAAEGCTVTLAFPFNQNYTAGGPNALTDGKWGSVEHTDGRWQGFEGKNLDATIDLGKEIQVQSIRVGFLDNNNSWIFLPLEVEFALSKDGQNYETVLTKKNAAPKKSRDPSIHDVFVKLDRIPARYVRVRAKSLGVCPAWHPGNGGAAWIFADEIQVNPQFTQ